LRETLSIMKKDFNSIRFERSYLSILILQLVLFATARSFSAGMILLSSPESAQEVFELEKLVRIGVMNFNLSLENLSYFNDKREGMKALEEGEINAFLVFLGEENGVKEFELYARRDDPKRELAVSLVRSELKELKEEIQLERMEEKDILLQFLENSVEMNFKRYTYRTFTSSSLSSSLFPSFTPASELFFPLSSSGTRAPSWRTPCSCSSPSPTSLGFLFGSPLPIS